MTARRWAAVLLLTAVVSGSPSAEVKSASREGFVISHELLVVGAPDRVFDALTARVGAWWDAEHSYSGEADNFSLDARAGGCFCEVLPNGGSVEHMRVVFASPGKLLRMVGGLGPLQVMGVSGTMEFLLNEEDEHRTRLSFRYVVGGFSTDGLESLAEPVDQVLQGQLSRLEAHLRGEQLRAH